MPWHPPKQAAPQLWRLEMVKDRSDSTSAIARLSLRHTYMFKTSVDFAGQSYFGGKGDQLVLCAGKGMSSAHAPSTCTHIHLNVTTHADVCAAGDIYVWDRDSAVPLHHIHASTVGRDLTCIAWNRAADDTFMLAMGGLDGAVRVWTTVADSGPDSEASPGPSRAYELSTWSSPTRPPSFAMTDTGHVAGSITTQPRSMSPEPAEDFTTPLVL